MLLLLNQSTYVDHPILLISENSNRFTKYEPQPPATSRELYNFGSQKTKQRKPRRYLHSTPYAFPNAFLSKPEVSYGEPCKPKPYRGGRNSAARTCRCRFLFNLRVELFSTVRIKKQAQGQGRQTPCYTWHWGRGTAQGPKLVFRSRRGF